MVLEQAEVVAIDPLLKAYAEKLPHFVPEDYPWVQFENIMLEHLSVGEPFDYVFCLNAINHVSDLQRSLAILVEATKTGQSLILSIDTHRWRGLKWLFRLLPGDVLHPHQHSLTDYQALLKQQDLQIIQKHRLKPGWVFDYWVLVARKG
jgi:2-polyprenyl-6-hydroxyphenyl methylase/3-demethylubiquinone-9 3-methyltransferase